MSNTVEFKIKISDISGDAVRNIRASLEGVDGVVEQITQSASAAGGALREAANEAFRWNQVKEVLSGVTDLLNQITAPAQQFNQSMREVNTMAGKGEQDFRRLKSAVSELSGEIPIARDLLARGLYQTISNGVPEDNWISFLDRSAKSAVGGIANLEKVVTVTSTVIKNYGLSWDEAGSIQDKIQTTAKNGVTSFEQLADALPRVSGNAATLGVSIDDLMATFATLTGVSGNTAEVSTQLAAIFTALIKPSSEAAKMAEQMGIEFNAASIKAAGGLIPFLENLNSRINDYAASSGLLREEIYGMLFGSAEALRAIIPLTGELGSKFVENSVLIADSAGTIDKAFEQINSTGDSVAQRLSNWASGFSDYATVILGTATPYIAFIAQTVTAVTQIKAFTVVVKSFTTGIMSSKAALAVKTVAMNVATTASNLYNIALVKLTAVFGSARIAAAALSATITLGLSVAIQAIIEVISRLTGKAEENTQAMSEAQQAQQHYKEVLTNARAEMKVVIAELAAFNGSKDDEARKVAELNAKYGESFGYYDTVAKWYDTLSQKSELYCNKIVNEARIRADANKIALLEAKKEEIAAAPDSEYDRTIKPSELEPSGDILMQTARDWLWKDIKIDGKDVKKGLNEQLDKEIAGLNTSIENRIKETANIDIQIKADDIAPSTTKISDVIKSLSAARKELNGLEDKNEWTKAEISRMATLNATITDLEGKYESLKGKKIDSKGVKLNKNYITPDDELPTPNFDKKVKEIFLQNLLVPPDARKSLEKINDAIDFYQEKVQQKTGVERAEAQRTLGIYQNAKTQIENMLSDISLPVDPKSFADFDRLISDLEGKLRKASDTEREGILSQINAYKLKRDAIEQSMNLVGLPTEVQQLVGVPDGLEMDLSIRLRGLDTVETELQRLQALAKVAQTDDEKRAIKGKIKGLREYADQFDDTNKTGKKTSAVFSGIGSIFSNLSNVVGEGAGAWLGYAGSVLGAISQMIPALASVAFAQTIASSQALPPPFNIIQLGVNIAAVAAALASVPKFADGGIAYGTTLGIFGEYSGAANNPEVVAPLNKLRSLIEPQGGTGEVTFRIEGRALVGILNKMNRVNSRT